MTAGPQDGERERGAGPDTGELPEHGTLARYQIETNPIGGRACDECRAANTRYNRQYRLRTGMVEWPHPELRDTLTRVIEQRDAARAATAAAQEQVAQAERERDEARAALAAKAAKSMEWAERAGEFAGSLDGARWDLDAARADLARMRPVVEAAEQTVDYWPGATSGPLRAAVDTYRRDTPEGGTNEH